MILRRVVKSADLVAEAISVSRGNKFIIYYSGSGNTTEHRWEISSASRSEGSK